MKSMKGSKGQMLRFLLVGGIAVAIDGGLYFGLTSAGRLDATWSKRVSFATGALWAFFANKLFTFQKSGFTVHEPLLFTFVYLAGWFLNSVIHDAVLHLKQWKWLAFLIATGVSTVTNFAGQKWLVFRANRDSASL